MYGTSNKATVNCCKFTVSRCNKLELGIKKNLAIYIKKYQLAYSSVFLISPYFYSKSNLATASESLVFMFCVA